MDMTIECISPNGCSNSVSKHNKSLGLKTTIHTLIYNNDYKNQLIDQEFCGYDNTQSIGECINQINLTIGKAQYKLINNNERRSTIMVEIITSTLSTKWHLKELKRVARYLTCKLINI
jgi:hypothetical protein